MGEKTIGRAFLKEFAYIDEGFKLKLPAKKVREFIAAQQLGMSFREFNKLLRGEGRTTGNKYVYDLIGINNACKMQVNKGREKSFSDETVKVLSYYGSKRSWREEFKLLYEYAAHSLGCTTMIDCFAGSGFLSLLAAKTGFFEKVILNELSTVVFNYHLVQKDMKAFKEFTHYLYRFGDVNEDLFQLMKDYLKMGYREKRTHVAKANSTRAASLFIVKNYSHSGQGGYIESRMAPSEHIEALERTHALYQSVTLSHHHYKKVLEKYMNDSNNLIILDPPYLQETRVQKKSYNLEFAIRQHRSLLQLLTKQEVKAKVILCGYHSGLYESYFMRYNKTQELTEGWHEVQLLKAGSKQEGAEAKERIWVNFEIESLVSSYKDLFKLVW